MKYFEHDRFNKDRNDIHLNLYSVT